MKTPEMPLSEPAGVEMEPSPEIGQEVVEAGKDPGGEAELSPEGGLKLRNRLLMLVDLGKHVGTLEAAIRANEMDLREENANPTEMDPRTFMVSKMIQEVIEMVIEDTESAIEVFIDETVKEFGKLPSSEQE